LLFVNFSVISKKGIFWLPWAKDMLSELVFLISSKSSSFIILFLFFADELIVDSPYVSSSTIPRLNFKFEVGEDVLLFSK
jgi:hypothetical protein